MSENGKTLVLGLGNPILGDDGVGWRVIEAIESTFKEHLDGQPIEFDCLSVGGLSLMERLVGYQRAIIVDASLSHAHPLGFVSSFPLDQLPVSNQGHLSSPHDTTLQNALEVGRRLGAHVPEDIQIIAIEAENLYEFTEQLSPAVAAAIPQAIDVISKILPISELNKESSL